MTLRMDRRDFVKTVALTAGIDSQKILDQALEAVRTFKPLTQAEVASLLKRTRSAALEGKYELYKTSTRFDGTQRHPEWLGEDPLAG